MGDLTGGLWPEAPVLAAWLLTIAVHSTVLLGVLRPEICLPPRALREPGVQIQIEKMVDELREEMREIRELVRTLRQKDKDKNPR